MKKEKVTKMISRVFILLSALSLLMVSIQAWYDPQLVMNLVEVNLSNNDASSSIRGVYGGVGITVFITLIYLMNKDISKGLQFLTLFWGLYAFSRLLTIFKDGQLGEFGNQWLKIESILFILSALLLIMYNQFGNQKKLQLNEKF